MNSITKRWVRGSLFFTVAVLLVAEALFLFFMISGYYDSATREVQAQLALVLNQLEYTTSSTNKTALLRSTVEQYEGKARFELMLVNARGEVVSSSSGVVPQFAETPKDIRETLENMSDTSAPLVGQNENGEKVIAITARTPFMADGVVAIRVVTSLVNVDKSIINWVLLSGAVILVIIFASLVSGVYFIRSIVIPIQNVEATAKRIAAGDFETRIDNNANDEVGKLCKTINNMADELGRSEKMKNEFISSVSHELRTPLTSIKGWAETMGGIKDPNDPTLRRGVEIIAGEADRLYDMVEELLDFSRMQNGITLAHELLDLAAEVEEAVLQQTMRASQGDIFIQYDAPEIPIPVMADKNRVRQVLLNIIDNAIKYSHARDTILVEILMDSSSAFVVVSDEGQGISQEDLEHVKMRFYKGKGATRGSGIGLAVVEEIMEAHEGALEITSEQGKGTQVTLRFPLHHIRPTQKEKQ